MYVVIFPWLIVANYFCQTNQRRFPTIFKMAMDILPIQASSVPCERVFSSAKETITPRRNRLAPDTMEACQMIKYALRDANLGKNNLFSIDHDKKF